MSHISAIGTANPPHRFSQSQIADFMTRAMQLSYEDGRKLRAIFKASGISHRHSVLEDYGRSSDFTFYSNADDCEPFPSTSKRLRFFKENALNLSYSAVKNMLAQRPGFDVKSITHLIVVCCTGMYAPGLDVDLVKKLSLSTNVQRTGVNFMGCYAAFNALKVADAFCKADAKAKVLVVCTELCSLHFQKVATEDNLLANALFADGSAAVLVEGETTATPRLRLENFCNELAIEGEGDMAWAIGDLGFEMKLSTYVPDIIKSGIARLTAALLENISSDISAIQFFAIHPGGRKILESIEDALGIDKEKNAPAYRVLKNYGNMSSPTVLFVLKDIFDGLTPAHNDQPILSFAFGPGLTLESMVLRIETE